MIGASFDSTKTPLQDLLVWADSGIATMPTAKLILTTNR